MSSDDDRPPKETHDANKGPEGAYIVGKGKPPESGKFRAGDGRKRGRRSKGTRNLETDFREEMQGLVTVSVNGKQRRVSKQRSLVMRLIDNAGRGQNGALKLALEYGGRFGGIESRVEPSVPTEALTHLDQLSEEELKELQRLLCKAADEPFEQSRLSPFAFRSDPDDPRNYVTERTVDGVHYQRSLNVDFDDRLISIENGAYRSAALPRRPGCNRRQY